MPIARYGVLKGHAVGSRVGTGSSPHYQIHLVDDSTHYRIAINIRSKLQPADLLYLVDDDFVHPITAGLGALPLGFSALASQPGGVALDYIRGNLFDRARMKLLPSSVPGPDNDLNERIGAVVERALGDEAATVYAFGQRWGPETFNDKIFGFLPGNGIHDIHMNQGNPKSSPQFFNDNGPYQDGGLLFHFPAVDGAAAEQWVALFLAFQSQAWHTDDRTGHPLVPKPDEDDDDVIVLSDGQVRIVAALVNPFGPGPEKGERVTLVNTTPQPVDLAGWAIANKNKQKFTLTGTVAAGAAAVFPMPPTVPLSNDGGIITLLDKAGLKVDGVSYTREQAKREGWTIVF